MKTMTDFDLVLSEHLTRTDGINQQGWRSQASQSTGVASASRLATLAASARRHLGMIAVHAGERLRWTPASSIANRVPA